MPWLRSTWDLLRRTATEWNDDKCPRIAAAIAYYTVFAMAPLLLIVIAVASLAFGSAFGAAGALAVLLAWVYDAALILLFGAEFTQVRADRDGELELRRGAVRVETRAIGSKPYAIGSTGNTGSVQKGSHG